MDYEPLPPIDGNVHLPAPSFRPDPTNACSRKRGMQQTRDRSREGSELAVVDLHSCVQLLTAAVGITAAYSCSRDYSCVQLE